MSARNTAHSRCFSIFIENGLSCRNSMPAARNRSLPVSKSMCNEDSTGDFIYRKETKERENAESFVETLLLISPR